MNLVPRLVNHHYKTFPFQVMLGRFVSTMTGSTTLQNFLSSVGLSTHRKTECNQNSIDAIKNVQTGVKLDSQGFALALCNNADYTGHAEKDHWTHFLLANNSKDNIKHDKAFELKKTTARMHE
eukprot:jgi/Psemu1/1791/gm1.1791_g